MKIKNRFLAVFMATAFILSGIYIPDSMYANAQNKATTDLISTDLSNNESVQNKPDNDFKNIQENNRENKSDDIMSTENSPDEKEPSDKSNSTEKVSSDNGSVLLNNSMVAKVGDEEFSSLYDAVDKISNSNTKSGTIQIISDSQETKKINIPTDVNITITGEEEINTITLCENKGIEIKPGASLTIDGNLHFLNAKIANCGSLTLDNGILDMCGKDIQTGSSEYYLGFISTYGKDSLFTMNGGTVTNGKISSSYGGVRVSSGGKFIMNDGTISKFSGKGTNSSAVLIYGDKGYLGNGTAEFIMNGGTICDNENYRGGGVCVVGDTKGEDYRAKMTMNGGSIENNKATGWVANDNGFSSAGGGLLVQGNAEAIMNDGNITDNTVLDGMGGAVATVENNIKEPTVFEMNGGTISGNKAIDKNIPSFTGFGGGIYSYSKDVTINGGTIENNEASHQGGGIYVSASGYKLYLYNAVIKNNEASILGGGYWTCPSGNSEAFISNGPAIYDNVSNGIGDDFVSVRFPWFNYVVTLPDRILGGGQVKWYKDGALKDISQLGEIDKTVPRYDASKENESVKSITNSKENSSLKSVVSDNAKELAEKEAKVFIQNNKAERGGGIATNGDVSIGNRNGKQYTLKVIKDWQNIDESSRKSIDVYLKIGDKILDSVELNAENNWTAEFTGLPDPASLSEGLFYSVVENPIPDGFNVEYTKPEIDNDKQLITISIRNKHIPSGDLNITKKVTGSNVDKDKKFTFIITLDDKSINGKYGDMDFTNGVATISLKDGESKSAKKLPAGIKYTVVENESGKDGYTTTSTNNTGTIKENSITEVEFINNKDDIVDPDAPPGPDTHDHFGGLIITKEVTGSKGDKNKEFTFTVKLSDTTINGKYGDMDFSNGIATINLKDNESIKAENLPAGIEYEVIENTSDKDGYTTSSTNAVGIIKENNMIEVKFINNKDDSSVNPDIPSGPDNPDPDTPNPDIPSGPDNPDPDISNPDIPSGPVNPDPDISNPDIPSGPVNPDPDIPSGPVNPDPDIPSGPVNPDPDIPSGPDNPDTGIQDSEDNAPWYPDSPTPRDPDNQPSIDTDGSDYTDSDTSESSESDGSDLINSGSADSGSSNSSDSNGSVITNPKTMDKSHLLLWLGLFILSGMLLVIISRRKKEIK